MPLSITVRSERPADYAAIKRVNDLAFGRPNEGKLIENLRHLPGFELRLSLIAESLGKIIGHALFTPIRIQPASPIAEERGGMSVAVSLGPIAVLPEYQKQGIGGQLILAGHRTALDLGYTAVVLLGHPEYYPRFGYQPAERWGLTNPWKITGDPWMATELIAGALRGKAGVVIYPEPFNDAT